MFKVQALKFGVYLQKGVVFRALTLPRTASSRHRHGPTDVSCSVSEEVWVRGVRCALLRRLEGPGSGGPCFDVCVCVCVCLRFFFTGFYSHFRLLPGILCISWVSGFTQESSKRPLKYSHVSQAFRPVRPIVPSESQASKVSTTPEVIRLCECAL